MNTINLKDITYKPKYPDMEIIPTYICDSQKNEAVNKAVYNLLQTFYENNLSLHEIKGVIDRITDEVMDRVIMSNKNLKDIID